MSFIFQSLCRDAEIGANSYLLRAGSTQVVLDAGMHPKNEGLESIPHYEWLEEEAADAVIVTHSHLDHIGTLPVLLKKQRKASVYMTPETVELGLALMHNSVNVMQAKRIELGITDYPFFTHKDLDQIKERLEHRGVERPFYIDDQETLKTTFYDAGHMLGSVGVMFEHQGKRLFYTGDVNFEDATLQKGALFPKGKMDVLIVETTRGSAPRDPSYQRIKEENALAEAINQVIHRKGSVLIPVFAIGKTQEVLAMLHRFQKEKKISSKTPIYMGGLSTKMTMIYDRFSDTSRRKLPRFKFLKDMDLEAGKRKNKGPIPFRSGCIYALSSGMMTEKTASNQFARQGLLENKKHGLFFVGYCDPDSPGGKIRESEVGDLVLLDPVHPPVKRNCEVRTFDFSGHAERESLLNFMLKSEAKQIVLVHGDADASFWFQEQLRELAPHVEVIIPEPGKRYSLGE